MAMNTNKKGNENVEVNKEENTMSENKKYDDEMTAEDIKEQEEEQNNDDKKDSDKKENFFKKNWKVIVAAGVIIVVVAGVGVYVYKRGKNAERRLISKPETDDLAQEFVDDLVDKAVKDNIVNLADKVTKKMDIIDEAVAGLKK